LISSNSHAVTARPIIAEGHGRGSNKLTGGFGTAMGGQTFGGSGFYPLVGRFHPLVARTPTLITLDAELCGKLE
jgi:hypothetical protein